MSLGICVSKVGEHISLGICVSKVGERISVEISVSQVTGDKNLKEAGDSAGCRLILTTLYVDRAIFEIRPLHKVDAEKRLKTVENSKAVILKSVRRCLREVVVY